MKYFAPIVALFFCLSLSAQDQQFTQFYASPTTLNPSLTGVFPGKFRVSMIYRDQWAQVLDKPYATYAAAADFRFLVKPYKRRYRDAFGVGVVFATDQVSQINFSTNQVMVSGAFHKSLNPESDQFLSLGFQVGMVQRNISYGALSFEDQFNGNNGYTDPTAEVFPENNFAFSDFQLGLNFSSAPEGAIGVFAGAAIHHLSEPEISFFFDDEDPTNLSPSNKLFRRYTAHASLQIPLGETLQVLPRAVYYQQGPHATLNSGANLRILVNDIKGTAIHIGSWLRSVKNESAKYSLDAVIALFGIEHQNFLLGFSYDIGLHYLDNPGPRRGAFEISAAYRGEYEDDAVLCPSF